MAKAFEPPRRHERQEKAMQCFNTNTQPAKATKAVSPQRGLAATKKHGNPPSSFPRKRESMPWH